MLNSNQIDKHFSTVHLCPRSRVCIWTFQVSGNVCKRVGMCSFSDTSSPCGGKPHSWFTDKSGMCVLRNNTFLVC